MKKIIAIIGKTRSGKDTVARYIKDKYGVNAVCSYTTRAKRDYETDGVEHYFVSDEKMEEILKTERILAYIRKPNGVQYGASFECLKDDIVVYIIDPNGIEDLENNIKDIDIEITKLYVQCPEEIIFERAKDTGVDLDITRERLAYEREEFDTFFNNKSYDFCIYNDSSLDELKSKTDEFMFKYFSEVKKV